ncbi:MAG: tail fiber protein [Pseudomonadota bacterium]
MNTKFLGAPVALAALAGGLMLAEPRPAHACDSTPFMGSICFTAVDFCPDGYTQVAGQQMATQQYQAVAALLGYRYGGDNRTYFLLPNLQSRTPVGVNTSLPTLRSVALAQYRGQEAIPFQAITVHDHVASFAGTGAKAPTYKVTLNASVPTDPNTNTFTLGNPANLAASPTGGSGAQMWSASLENQVPIGGVVPTVSGSLGGITGGTVTVTPSSDNNYVNTIPPELGILACIAVNTGMWPQKPE